jgi:hypothetical protein
MDDLLGTNTNSSASAPRRSSPAVAVSAPAATKVYSDLEGSLSLSLSRARARALSLSLSLSLVRAGARPAQFSITVKRDLLQCQKRPNTVSKENLPARARSLGATRYTHTHTHTHTQKHTHKHTNTHTHTHTHTHRSLRAGGGYEFVHGLAPSRSSARAYDDKQLFLKSPHGGFL